MEGLEDFAGWSLDTLARGNVQLARREQAWREMEREFMARELGLDTERKRNNFIVDMKKLRKSGVKKAGELRKHRVRLTVDEAREVVSMTKQEREARNDELKRAAESLGVDAENIVTDEDVDLLRDELAKAHKAPSAFDESAEEKQDFRRRVLDVFGAENKPKKSHVFKVCAYPEVMKKVYAWEGDVVIRWDNMEKLNRKHGLTPEQIAELPRELGDPIAVIEDTERENEYMVVTAIEAPDNNGNIKKATAILKLRSRDGKEVEIADVASVYARDDYGKYKKALENGKLKYLDKERAGEWARMEGRTMSQLLTTILAEPGSGVIVKEELLNVKNAGKKYVQIERAWREEPQEEGLILSKDEALNIILLCEQTGYADAAADHGFTPEVLDGLRKYVGEDVLAYGYFMRAGLDGNGLADVYEAAAGGGGGCAE